MAATRNINRWESFVLPPSPNRGNNRGNLSLLHQLVILSGALSACSDAKAESQHRQEVEGRVSPLIIDRV